MLAQTSSWPCIVACKNSCPSMLPAQVVLREKDVWDWPIETRHSQSTTTHKKFAPSCRMSYNYSHIQLYVQVALSLANSDVHQQLMRSTWRIETMVLPELSRTMAYRTQHSQQTWAKEAIFKSCGTRTIKRGINLYIELQKHKLDQIAARKIRISLDKRIAFSKQS